MPGNVSNAPSSTYTLLPLAPLEPDLRERSWLSVPHPTLPLIATAHSKSVTIFSLATASSHSSLTGGHTRSVRSVAWKPGLPPHKLCLVTGSFDSTAGLWRWDGDEQGKLETEITSGLSGRDEDDSDAGDKDWEFTLVLEGHDSEIKSCAFNPSGVYLATCSRDKSVWIWEDIGATEADDEWETIAVLNEHEGDVKAVAWCPDVPGRNARRRYSPDVLASASYDNTVRIWREDGEGDWVCVAVLEGHEGTVWGVQWEPRPKSDMDFPRLLTFSADGTIRIWTLEVEDDGDDDDNVDGDDSTFTGPRSRLGGIPNTMRGSLRENWRCTDTLPKVHEKDIYTAAWSATSGLVASSGSDGIVVLYQESIPKEDIELETNGQDNEDQVMQDDGDLASRLGPGVPNESRWDVFATQENAHGPFEVNHVVWCRRFDGESQNQGEGEMLVTTGDDGLVRRWQISKAPSS